MLPVHHRQPELAPHSRLLQTLHAWWLGWCRAGHVLQRVADGLLVSGQLPRSFGFGPDLAPGHAG